MDEGFDWIVDDVGEMLGSLPKASLHSSKQGPTNLCSALPLHVSSTELASWKWRRAQGTVWSAKKRATSAEVARYQDEERGPDQEGGGCSIGAWLQHQGLPIPLAPQYNVSAICEYWVQVMNFLWVDPKKRGVSKKKFSYFFMLYLDSANKKSDRTRYQFFHPTTPTHPNRPPPLGGGP